MCDANDENSDCALGCQRPQALDPAGEDEMPKPDEVIEPVKEVGFDLKFKLAPGTTDGKSLEVMKQNIEGDLEAVYDAMNPFEDGITKVTATIEEICKKEGEDPFPVAEGVSCEDAANRKRRGVKDWVEDRWDEVEDLGEDIYDGTMDFLGYTRDLTVYASVSFYSSIENRVIPWTVENAKKFAKQAEEIAVKLVNTVVEFANDVIDKILGHLCKAGKMGRIVGEGLNNLRNTGNDALEMTGVTKKKVDELDHSFELAKWMTGLPEKIKNLPLTQMAIPGSHRSSTYAMMPVGLDPYAPDSVIYQKLEKNRWANQLISAVGHKAGFSGFVMMWSQTVHANLTMTEQLKMGLRYFDLRSVLQYFLNN